MSEYMLGVRFGMFVVYSFIGLVLIIIVSIKYYKNRRKKLIDKITAKVMEEINKTA